MEKLNITPKPWHVMRGDVLDQHGRMVAAVDSFDTDDAHLIAAAPELFEALRQIKNYVEDKYWGESSLFDVEGHPINLAHKAIAKALGK